MSRRENLMIYTRYGSTWTIATTAKQKRSMEKSSWTKHTPEKEARE